MKFTAAARPRGARRPPRSVRRKPIQWEAGEQRVVAAWLNLAGIWWEHVPNGGARDPITGAHLKALGVKRGSPDIRIYDRPPLRPDKVGVALELKRADGKGRESPEQREWSEKLTQRGWLVAFCAGAGEAIKLLKSLGYGGGF
jgi:hypothetical protein